MTTRLRGLVAAGFLMLSVYPAASDTMLFDLSGQPGGVSGSLSGRVAIDVTTGTVLSVNFTVPGFDPLNQFSTQLVSGDTPLQFWDGVNILKNQTVFVPPPGQILLYATNDNSN